MFNNKDFFPTPKNLINEMLSKIDFKMISSVLEPSAGKGDIVESVIDKFKYSRSSYYDREAKWDIDCIEIDEDLQHILKGKEYRVVHNNFLTYNSLKHYDLIVANFPFSEGDKHLLKALEMQKDRGGQIVCLINSETLKNPYSNTRKDLLQKLEEYNAEIKYIPDAFLDAERKTYVETALIYISIKKPKEESKIIEELRQEEIHREESEYNSNNLINADFLKGIVEQYNFEVKAGLKLIAEYNAMKPLILKSFKSDNSSPILELKLSDKDDTCNIENGYIKQVRMKYWRALFTSDQFMGLFTSNLKRKYYDMVNELQDYDFSLYNIYTIKIQLNNEMVQGVEDTILNLFDEFSRQSSWDKEFSKNIHYYSGWASNSCWKVNPKIIIRLSGFNDWDGRYEPTDYKVIEKLTDVEKVFNYLDNGLTEEVDMKNILKLAKGFSNTKKIPLKYFTVTFYKKGTCHIEFTNLEILQKFNLFGSQRKGWLPPSYGKKQYKDMSKEESSVIDEFEGKESYTRVMNNTGYYIVETSKLLMLA